MLFHQSMTLFILVPQSGMSLSFTFFYHNRVHPKEQFYYSIIVSSFFKIALFQSEFIIPSFALPEKYVFFIFLHP